MAERKTAKPKTFEQMLARLDEIVRSLEKGDAPLEESLSLYTEGAELIRTCTKQLDEAEQTVVKLQKVADGAPVETSFASENELPWIISANIKPSKMRSTPRWRRISRQTAPKRSFWTPCAILSSPEESASDRCCS